MERLCVGKAFISSIGADSGNNDNVKTQFPSNCLLYCTLIVEMSISKQMHTLQF